MPRFLVERDVPRAHKITPTVLQQIAARSSAGVAQLGNGTAWIQSFVLRDRIVCVFDAPDEQSVRMHAEAVGFPAQRVREVTTMFGPEFVHDPAQRSA